MPYGQQTNALVTPRPSKQINLDQKLDVSGRVLESPRGSLSLKRYETGRRFVQTSSLQRREHLPFVVYIRAVGNLIAALPTALLPGRHTG